MPRGSGSVQLARLFGIRVGVSSSWFAILFVVIYLLSGSFRDILNGSDTEAYVVAVLAALLFFASLLAHELGHALEARRHGIAVAGIELWLLGGIATMSRDSRSPREEFRIAAAGPAVTLAVVALCVGAGTAIAGLSRFVHVALLDGQAKATPALLLLSWLASVNAALFVFNLVPAFPLDGGRIARAAAWRVTGDRARATRLSGRAGQVFAYLLAAAGFALLASGDPANGIWLLVLAFFLGQSARAAVLQAHVEERLTDVTVADVMEPDPPSLPADTTVLDASDREADPRQPWVALTAPGGRFVGALRREAIDAALAEGRPALTLGEVAGDAPPATVALGEPLEALLADDALRRTDAVFAVDGDGVLRGVVTLDRVRRALSPAR